MRGWLALFVAVPLLSGAAVVFLARSRIRLQRIIGLATASASFLGAAVLLVVVGREGPVATRVGDWPPPFAITLVADAFSALVLLVTTGMVVACLAFAAARREDERPFFHALVQVLAAGVAGSLLTGDLFNLFVFVEVMLAASYVLLSLGGAGARVRAGAVYVTVNLLGSTVLLAGVALVYATAGTVNLAELASAARAAPSVAIGGSVVLAALGVKGALVPAHGWLPRTYPAAPPAVTALFSGLLTKVGIYAIYRVYAVVFGGDPALRTPLLVVAGATMLVGVLGAVGRESMRDILAFHMVSQVGYLILALGLFGPVGLTAGVFYLAQYIVVKTALFLSAGAVETLEGSGRLDRLGGLAPRRPILALAFFMAAVSLAGLPPFSGFFAKLSLITAAFEGHEYWAGATAIVVSFLTLLSMVKIWGGVFWGDEPDRADVPEADRTAGDRDAAPVRLAPRRDARERRAPAVIAPAAILALTTLALGIGAQGLIHVSQRAAAALVDVRPYVEVILRP